jgi:predicted negative regulator of RcsB-dependent stress response
MSDQSEPEAKTTSATKSDSAIQTLAVKGVALLLLAVALIAGGLSYGVSSWQQRNVAELQEALASQQTTIKTVNDTLTKMREESGTNLTRMREENNAGLSKLREENSAGLAALRAENAELRAQLAAAESRASTTEAAFAKSQQRDPNALYQLGAEVARVAGAKEDRDASIVTFESIDGGNFDRGKEFDWRDLTLKVKSHKGAMTSFTGRGVQIQMTGVEATIVRTRAAP